MQFTGLTGMFPFLGGGNLSSKNLPAINYASTLPLPDGWSRRQHRESVLRRSWNAEQAGLLRPERSLRYKSLWWQLWGKSPMGMRELQFLLEHSEHIPASWQEDWIIGFFGTIDLNSDGDPMVPCLCGTGHRLFMDYYSLACGWPKGRPIARWL